MQILAPRKLLRKFRKECRETFPKEHFAVLFGKRSDRGALMITRIAPVAYDSTVDGLDPKKGVIEWSKTQAIKNGDEWLGTIHSHCHRATDPACWCLSEQDVRTAMAWGESVCGLVYVYDRGKRTSLHWYIPQPLPEVAYY